MIDTINPELLKNGKIFDFDNALNSYGFPIDELIENHFQKFIDKTINEEFISLRKNISKQSYKEVRELSHKLKTVFNMLGAIEIYNNLELIQKSIDDNKIENIKGYYLSLIKEMDIFIKELENFGKKVGCEVNKQSIEKYKSLSKECDINDSNNSTKKSDVNDGINKKIIKSDDNNADIGKGNVEIDDLIKKDICCKTGCEIF